MSERTTTANTPDPLDLAALGGTWTPPRGTEHLRPEAPEVIATLPRWGARGMLYTLAAFITALLLWAHLSVLDVVVAGRGALAPEGYVQPVQAEVGGRVKYVLAREGDTVRKGQALLQLDRTEPRERLETLREAVRAAEAEREHLRATGAPLAEALEAERDAAELRAGIAAAEEALARTAVIAPAGGVLTELAVRGEGAVLAPGQIIGAIAPENTPLVARAYLANRDIGWVRPGLPVRIKLDAFPFQDYGTVSGTVITVSPDARTDGRGGSAYEVTVATRTSALRVGDKNIPFRPGLTLSAEIATERRSVLSFFLAPLRRLKAEAETLR